MVFLVFSKASLYSLEAGVTSPCLRLPARLRYSPDKTLERLLSVQLCVLEVARQPDSLLDDLRRNDGRMFSISQDRITIEQNEKQCGQGKNRKEKGLPFGRKLQFHFCAWSSVRCRFAFSILSAIPAARNRPAGVTACAHEAGALRLPKPASDCLTTASIFCNRRRVMSLAAVNRGAGQRREYLI